VFGPADRILRRINRVVFIRDSVRSGGTNSYMDGTKTFLLTTLLTRLLESSL
jgi:hypothetical protein